MGILFNNKIKKRFIMAKPISVDANLYPFGSLGDNKADKLLKDDYCYKSFETYKLKATTTNGSAIQYKADFNILKKNDAYSGKGGDELKVTFPLSGTDLIARIL